MIQQQNIIDVFHIVKTLRNNKSNMVETLVSIQEPLANIQSLQGFWTWKTELNIGYTFNNWVSFEYL